MVCRACVGKCSLMRNIRGVVDVPADSTDRDVVVGDLAPGNFLRTFLALERCLFLSECGVA